MDYFSQRRLDHFTPSPSVEDIAMDVEHPDDKELLRLYAPLSNLPTPPLTITAQTPSDEDLLDSNPWIVAASTHLSNLVPQRAARTRLAPSIIATYLNRAKLSCDHLALAACILDSLSSFFVRNWRSELSRLPVSSPTSHPSTPHAPDQSPGGLGSSRFSFPAAGVNWSIDNCNTKPELIVLASLQLATSILDDVRRDARWWAHGVARGAVTAREVDTTMRCILQNVEYDLGYPPEEVEAMKEFMFEGLDY